MIVLSELEPELDEEDEEDEEVEFPSAMVVSLAHSITAVWPTINV